MSWQRQQRNHDQVRRDKSELSAARWALEDYRKCGDLTGFPNLRRRIAGSIYGLRLSGFGLNEVEPPLTQEEYDRFEAAYDATEEGQAEQRRRDEYWKKLLEEE